MREYKRFTEKRKGKNVIPLLDSVCGVDLPKWTIAKESEIRRYLSGNAVDRFAELEDKIEQGKILELPCKVGDKVYRVVADFIVEYRVHKIEFHITEDKKFGYCLFCDNYDLGDFDYFYKKSIGKEVFLTKAEAEQKLKELNVGK